jgi:hypothetical protein
MLKILETQSGDIKIIYKDRSYILPKDVYNMLVQLIVKDLNVHKN